MTALVPLLALALLALVLLALVPVARRAVPDPRRLATIGGLLAIGYAAVVALLVGREAAPDPPGVPPAWAMSFALLAMPGLVGLIAGRRGNGALVAVAGGTCLLQAFVSFAGVTIPFVVPAAVLLSAARASGGVRARDIAAGAAVVGCWLGAWIARLTQVEERCWSSSGGTACSSGVPTMAGIATTVALLALALAIASLAPGASQASESR